MEVNIRPSLSHSNSFGNDAEKDTAGCRAFNRKYIVIGGIPMQHTQQDETILRTEPKEDIDDLIFRADPGWMVSER